MATQAHLNEVPGGAPVPWFFRGEGGRLLYAQRWEPWPPVEVLPAPPVVLVHGFGEHIGRYENLGRALAASGRSLWAMDLAGFGRSDGSRAMVQSLDSALADIGRLVEAATKGNPDEAQPPAGGPLQPVPPAPPAGERAQPVLLGQSMGGAFAAAFALAHPGELSGLVLSAPILHLASRPKWQVLPAQALAFVAPRTGLGRVSPPKLSRDPEVVAEYVADPLVWHGAVPVRTVMEMYRAGRTVMKRAGELEMPLLVLHGESDAIVPVSASRELFAIAGSNDKQLRTFKGLLHEPFNEKGKQEVIAILLEWLAKH